MAARQEAPYGSWRSPITTEEITAHEVRLGQIAVDGETVYWSEGRPLEGGRYVVARRDPDGTVSDVTPEGFNARTRVHEYGGGAYWVHDGSVYFANYADQRLYRQDRDAAPRPITPEPDVPSGARYADGCVTPDGRLIVCVRETHAEGREAVNEIVVIPTDGAALPRPLVSGNDFYSFPRLSPDGRRLAWTTWNHPRMPWDGSELWVGELSSDGTLANPRLVAGGSDEAIFQPSWSPDGTLYVVSDRSGWWNLYRERDGAIEALAPMEAEFGLPQWVFGLSTYAFLADGRIACTFEREGATRLGLLTPGQDGIAEIENPYSQFAYLTGNGRSLYFVGAGPTRSDDIVRLDPDSGATEVLRQSREQGVDPGYISIPQSIEFPTEGGLTAHAFFYAPANKDYTGMPGERPPLLVISHGGPTSATSPELDLGIQFWTSRGFAVVDVNYGGSTGYGRAYRQRLNGQWGVVDTADCINAARYLAERGDADGQRLAIRGGSAGGYTTLCALVFHDDFAAGASYYGVADAEALARDTHKFESRYLDGMIGPYPEAVEVYRARSPIHFTERLSAPMIIFQGLEDKVVPPAQAEQMVAALRAKGLPFAYVPFEGEQHGFRRAENIRRSLEAELYFYGRVFGFQPADAIEPVAIENL